MKKTGKGKWNYSLDFYFFWVNLCVFAVIVIVSALISALLYQFFHLTVQIPEAVYSVVLCIGMGAAVSHFLSKKILAPINKLGQAMSKVAQGDFTVKLETNSKLSEIRKLYGDFNLMVKELAATETLQMDFVSNVSHEFKTPISAIDGYATLLQGDPHLTEEQAEYTDKIVPAFQDREPGDPGQKGKVPSGRTDPAGHPGAGDKVGRKGDRSGCGVGDSFLYWQ